MSFQQGLSGLNGAAKSLDVIGNNIANASTVGFKGSQAQFADVYANSLSGAGGNQAGIGVKVSQIAQQFTQGNVESSNNPLDIAINGAGFFRTTVGGAVQYSRNGQFSLDKSGYMVNAQGAQLTGYQVGPNGTLLAGSPAAIRINTADLKPVATTAIKTELNLDSRETNPAKAPFDVDDPNTYNTVVPIDVFDSLGNAHPMNSYYVRTNAGTWDVYVANDGMEINNLRVAAAAQGTTAPFAAVNAARDAWKAAAQAVPADAAATAAALKTYSDEALKMVVAAAADPTIGNASAAQQAVITNAGNISGAVSGNTPEDVDRDIAKAVHLQPTKVGTLNFDAKGTLSATTPPMNVNLTIFPPTGAANVLPVSLSFTGTSQYGSATSEKAKGQDGYAAGHLQSFAAAADGTILGQYSNGKSQALGQIVLANFANPNGLSPLGNNAWAETSASGNPLIGVPTSGSLGVLQSSAVESSNVDLTAELVNMITAQRVYQANAQTIKTQDSVLQTLVNLR
ncbi:MAG: flagellar hook protein FlgE [Massilia sp.]